MWFETPAAVERIRTGLPGLVEIGTARDLSTARIETLRAPSAWVVILSENADAVRYEVGTFIEQAVTVRFAVILAVRDLADRSGARASDEVRGTREALHRCLLGWQPQDATSCCRFARGALLSGIGRDGMLFWQDEFTVTYDRRTQPETNS